MFLPSGSLLSTQQRQRCHFWRNEEGRPVGAYDIVLENIEFEQGDFFCSHRITTHQYPAFSKKERKGI